VSKRRAKKFDESLGKNISVGDKISGEPKKFEKSPEETQSPE
jgi:hypothetical protein